MLRGAEPFVAEAPSEAAEVEPPAAGTAAVDAEPSAAAVVEPPAGAAGTGAAAVESAVAEPPEAAALAAGIADGAARDEPAGFPPVLMEQQFPAEPKAAQGRGDHRAPGRDGPDGYPVQAADLSRPPPARCWAKAVLPAGHQPALLPDPVPAARCPAEDPA